MKRVVTRLVFALLASVLTPPQAAASPVFSWTCLADCENATGAFFVDFTPWPLDGTIIDSNTTSSTLYADSNGDGVGDSSNSGGFGAGANPHLLTGFRYDPVLAELVVLLSSPGQLGWFPGFAIWSESSTEVRTWYVAADYGLPAAEGHLVLCEDQVSLSGKCFHNYDSAPNPVPEPSSLLLLGMGLAGLVAKRARRRQS